MLARKSKRITKLRSGVPNVVRGKVINCGGVAAPGGWLEDTTKGGINP